MSDIMSDIIACLLKENAIDRTTYHLAQAFHTEINEDSRLIDAESMHSLGKNFPMISLAKGYE